MRRLSDLRAELGAGDAVTARRWAELEREQAYFAERLAIAEGAATQRELFRLIIAADDRFAFPPEHDPRGDRVAPRWWFHLTGLRHGAVHAVLTTPQGWFIAQRRSRTKDESPGALDVATSGHIGTESPSVAIGREVAEEIGLDLAASTSPLMGPLAYHAWYDGGEERSGDPLFMNRERRWIFTGQLTAAGLSQLRFADGEVTSLLFVGPIELAELADRCRRQALRVPGECDLAWGIVGTLPRWLDRTPAQ